MPSELRQIIQDCWELDPTRQPSMDQLKTRLVSMAIKSRVEFFSQETQDFIINRQATHQEVLAAENNYEFFICSSTSRYYSGKQLTTRIRRLDLDALQEEEADN